MKNKILFFILIVLVLVFGYVRSLKNQTSFFDTKHNVTIKDMETNVAKTLEMEEYLIGVIAGEMPASFNIEALKAQAVAARTYAYYKISTSSGEYDLTTDSNTQVYLNENEMKSKWKNEYDYYVTKIIEAIKATKDEVITFKGEIIPAYYFSMSNGFTEDAVNVFGEDKSYLQKVESKEDATNKNFMVQTTISKEIFCQKLNIDCCKIIVSNVDKNESERVENITINNISFTGIELRKLLNLRSTDFEFIIKENDIMVTTYGYGHGVGMSQYGANTMANEGYNYQEILKHYYTGTDIKNINSIK